MKKINILFFLLLPIIDVITSITTKLLDIDLSIGIIVKSLYIIVLSIYIIFYSKSKKKKNYLYYLGIILIFSLLYFITKSDILEFKYLFKEVSYIFKAFYTSLLFFGLIVIFDDYKIDKECINKVMFYNLIIYTILLLVPTLTNTNFETYSEAFSNKGSLGWFYSANDTSACILMLYPFIYSFINDKKNIYKLLLIPVILSIFIIGTKTSWFGLIVINIIFFIISLIKDKKNNKITTGIVLLTTILLTFISPVASNMNKNIINIDDSKNDSVELTPAQQQEIDIRNQCKLESFKERFNNEKVYNLLDKIVSGRQDKAYTELLIYNDSKITDKFFGIGFTNTNRIDNCNVEKYIEIDILDLLVHYGILGLIIVLIPFGYVTKLTINNKVNIDKVKYISIILLMVLISCLAGHVIGYPTSGIYLSIYLLLLCIEDKEVEN